VREAVSSRTEIQCQGEGAPVVIPTRFTEDVRTDFRVQNRLDFRRIVRIGVVMGWPSQSHPYRADVETMTAFYDCWGRTTKKAPELTRYAEILCNLPLASDEPPAKAAKPTRRFIEDGAGLVIKPAKKSKAKAAREEAIANADARRRGGLQRQGAPGTRADSRARGARCRRRLPSLSRRPSWTPPRIGARKNPRPAASPGGGQGLRSMERRRGDDSGGARHGRNRTSEIKGLAVKVNASANKRCAAL
jgi:hypothetical protein